MLDDYAVSEGGRQGMSQDLHTKAARLPPLTALVYDDGRSFARLSRRLAAVLKASGMAPAGFVQHDEERPGRSRCDMVLENLQTGERVPISEDRGAEARGCRLDPNALVAAVEDVRATLGSQAGVLVLSKFGKSEAEGSGYRPLIAQALELGVPIILGVPRRNIENWRHFAEDLAREVEAEVLASATDGGLLRAIGLSDLAAQGSL